MPDTACITYLGHSSLLIEADGLRLLTDPVFRERVTILRRTGPAVEPANFRDIDIVLISHLHFDHLDFNSLRQVEGTYRLVAPRGAGSLLEKNGFRDYQEVQDGDEIGFGALSLRAVFADHHRRRHPLGVAADCLGFIIHGGVKIYYPGDTRLFPGMADLAGDLDVALLPVWGWGPDRGRLHMGPKEAVESLNLLQPRIAVPIHWGTYIPFWLNWTKPGFHYYPPLEFAARAKKDAPQVKVRILLPGESLQV
jgi:L-ascorbate metabolism protein UlaG (beta-lactamase superfamily)